jgi:hypothetical protein
MGRAVGKGSGEGESGQLRAFCSQLSSGAEQGRQDSFKSETELASEFD